VARGGAEKEQAAIALLRQTLRCGGADAALLLSRVHGPATPGVRTC